MRAHTHTHTHTHTHQFTEQIPYLVYLYSGLAFENYWGDFTGGWEVKNPPSNAGPFLLSHSVS